MDRKDKDDDLVDILKDALPRMRTDRLGVRGGGGGGAPRVNPFADAAGDASAWKRPRFGELYQARRMEQAAQQAAAANNDSAFFPYRNRDPDADTASVPDSEGTSVLMDELDNDDDAVSLDSFASGGTLDSQGTHMSQGTSGGGMGGAGVGTGLLGMGGGASRRAGMARVTGAKGGLAPRMVGGEEEEQEQSGVTQGEFICLGIGFVFLLVFSYTVQYLARHGILVPPTLSQ